jgi:hypothetical protein
MLSRAPYSFTPKEIGEITPSELCMIFTTPKKHFHTPVNDIRNYIKDFQKKANIELNIWDNNIWV